MAAKKPPKPPEDGDVDDDVHDDVRAVARDEATPSMFGVDAGAQAYQVLARKYRPQTFEDLAGQEAMVRTLRNAFKTGRIAHAFMLTGVRGVGKTTTARLLARALNYESNTVHEPSIEALKTEGVHCRAIIEGRHIDVLELDAASHTKVEEMRELLDGARYAPVSARYKVYIIDEVHMLSTASFNALLKTLEEPPPHVKFIFATTEIRRVPVTVLSRCQRFNLQRFSTEALADHLANICRQEGAKAQPEALALIARAAEGSARDALSILDQAIVQGGPKGAGAEVTAEAVRDMLGLADRSRVLDLLEKAVAGDHKGALSEASALLEAGADASVLIKDLLDCMTEVSRAKALGEAYQYAGPADWAGRTQAMAQRLSPAQASRMWRLLLQGFEDAARAPDPPAAAQMVVLRLSAVAGLPPPEDVGKLKGAASDGAGAQTTHHQAVSRPGTLAPARRPEPVLSGAGASGSVTPVSVASGPVVSGPAVSGPAVSGPAVSGSAVSGSAVSGSGVSGPLALAALPSHHHDDEPPGKRMASLREIVAELDAQRAIDLKYEIEQYVRPAEIDYGHFRYTAAPGAPSDLSLKIRTWLETTSGVEWEVLQSDDGAAESPAERRKRRGRERFAAAEAHPRVAEALRAFPGARLLRVENPDEPSEALEFEEPVAASNVIHVDFAARGGEDGPNETVAWEDIPPDAYEDDDE